MKIIEALKEVPLIDKKVSKNKDLLDKYASAIMIGKVLHLSFKTKEEQEQEVQGLLKSTNDLLARRAKIRRALSLTNATIIVEINGVKKTISEWIEFRDNAADRLVEAYSALSDTTARQQMREQGQVDVAEGISSVRFFDEATKNTSIEEVTDLKNRIDTTLETVNATTDLVEAIA